MINKVNGVLNKWIKVYSNGHSKVTKRVLLLSKIYLSTRVPHSCLVIFSAATWPMYWPAICGVSVKIIIIMIIIMIIIIRTRIIKTNVWSLAVPINSSVFYAATSCCHVLYILTIDWPAFHFNYNSNVRLANNPVIDIWLDHNLLSNVLPKSPVYSSKWRFI